jgi:hypothetical protein
MNIKCYDYIFLFQLIINPANQTEKIKEVTIDYYKLLQIAVFIDYC